MVVGDHALDVSLEPGDILGQFVFGLHPDHDLIKLANSDWARKHVLLAVQFLVLELQDSEGAIITRRKQPLIISSNHEFLHLSGVDLHLAEFFKRVSDKVDGAWLASLGTPSKEYFTVS